jgi:hypothetical protein
MVMGKSKKTEMRILAATIIAVIACLGVAVGAAAASPTTGMELEFAGDTAELSAGQVAIPMECIGEPTGFCSGTLAISFHGRRSVSTFSVQGGHGETVVVPLPGEADNRRFKVSAVATTSQSLGPAVTRKAVLHLG